MRRKLRNIAENSFDKVVLTLIGIPVILTCGFLMLVALPVRLVVYLRANWNPGKLFRYQDQEYERYAMYERAHQEYHDKKTEPVKPTEF